jgi:C_GCAxxG_C_C family probable redox protein
VTSDKCEQAKAQALAGYLDPGPGHLNCAQAVTLGGLLVAGQDPTLIDVANYLGGGMARMGEACGALTGAAIALGLRDHFGDSALPKNSGFDPLQQLIRDFELEFGALRCKDLLGCDISTAQGFRGAKKAQALSRCPKFVGWTIDRLGQVLCEEPSDS